MTEGQTVPQPRSEVPALLPPPPPAGRPCPGCGAAVRPGAEWCTLCFADLRPPPPPRIVAPAAVVRAAPPAPQALPTAGTAATPAYTDVPPGLALGAAALVPCTVCEAPMPISATSCTSCGSGLLDGLRSTQAISLRLPLLGDVMRFGRGVRAALALGLALLLVLILLLPFVVF